MKKNFYFGIRTFKTAFSVMLCILIFKILNRGNSMIASLSAAFSIRENMLKSLHFGKSRLITNFLAIILSIIYFFIKKKFLKYNFFIEILILPIFIILLIIISDKLNKNVGIISGLATLLIICLGVIENENNNFLNFLYIINRIIDTIFGILISIFVNFLIGFKKINKEKK